MRRCWAVLAALCLLLGVLLCRVFPAVRFTGFLLLCAVPVLLLWGALSARRHRRWARTARLVLSAALAAGFVFFAVLEVRVISAGVSDGDTPVRAVVILGAGVNGTEPSLSLRARLEAALDYLADRPDIPVVVSGGQGSGEEISEAACMAAWLTDRGVSPDRVYLEERARNTEENIRFSQALLAAQGIGPGAAVAVVTSDYHLYRVSLYWEGPGLVPVAAQMPLRFLPLTVNYYIREAFGAARFLIWDK